MDFSTPTRLFHPWDSSGKNTGVGCHFVVQEMASYTKCHFKGNKKKINIYTVTELIMQPEREKGYKCCATSLKISKPLNE